MIQTNTIVSVEIRFLKIESNLKIPALKEVAQEIKENWTNSTNESNEQFLIQFIRQQ